MARVGAVILAAGGSSRFGKPKQLVQFEGQTLIARAFSAAFEAGCHPVVIVTGTNACEITSALPKDRVSIVENSDWATGIGTSIRTGVQHLLKASPANNAVILTVCDQPFVRSKNILDLIIQWNKTGKPIVASAYSNTLGVPALFDSSCFDELLQLSGDTGAKSIILEDRARVAEVCFPEGASDIDTVEDYERLTSNA